MSKFYEVPLFPFVLVGCSTCGAVCRSGKRPISQATFSINSQNQPAFWNMRPWRSNRDDLGILRLLSRLALMSSVWNLEAKKMRSNTHCILMKHGLVIRDTKIQLFSSGWQKVRVSTFSGLDFPIPKSQKPLFWGSSQGMWCCIVTGGALSWLIDVEKPLVQDPRLVEIEADSEQLEYIALSYCWGRIDNFITTSETLQKHKNGIPLRALPNPIHDAVIITRELGIQYL